MRVSPINNSNNTNFQMLKIDKKSVFPLLEKESPELVARLDELGKDIINIRRYNVVLRESLVPKVMAEDVKANGTKDYFADFKKNVEPYLGMHYSHIAGDETVQGYYPKVPRLFTETLGKEEGAEEYQRFKKLDKYGQAALLSRILNQRDYDIEAKALKERLEAQKKQEMEELLKQAHREEIFKLMNAYGEEMGDSAQPTSLHKSFFERFFDKFIRKSIL